MKKKNNNDIPLKILLFLKKKDRPLIASHIAKGLKERSRQIVEYHLKQLAEKGIILVKEEYEKKFYFLQPNFYMEDAELTFMKILKPWIEEFAKQTEITVDMKGNKAGIVLNNLEAYWQIILQNVKENLQTSS